MSTNTNLTRADSFGKPRRFKVTIRRNVLLGGGALAFAGAGTAYATFRGMGSAPRLPQTR